jgi:hypothetical protein
MPTSPSSACLEPGASCPNPAIYRGRCAKHSPDKKRGTTKQRGYAGNWPRLRKMVLHEEPVCRECRIVNALYAGKTADQIAEQYNLDIESVVLSIASMRQRNVAIEPRRPNESTQVDHIVPKSQGGTNDRVNLAGICGPDHARKSASEGFAQ